MTAPTCKCCHCPALSRIKTEEDRTEVLAEAERRLEELKLTVWRKVAEELRTEDDYQFIRAYSPGLQEWVEALSFYHFLRHEAIISHQETEDQLRFSPAGSETEASCVRVTVPQAEYVLGLADLTGELMRNAINALGSGDMEVGLGWTIYQSYLSPSDLRSEHLTPHIFRSVSLCWRSSKLWPRVSADSPSRWVLSHRVQLEPH